MENEASAARDQVLCPRCGRPAKRVRRSLWDRLRNRKSGKWRCRLCYHMFFVSYAGESGAAEASGEESATSESG